MRKIVMLVIFTLLCIGTVSADLSEGLFCLLKKDEVIISLKQTDGYYKCKDTIASLEHLIIETAKNLMKVQIYINRGRDVEYRKTVKVNKKILLDKLQLTRTTIIANTKTFEGNILQKSVQYFIVKITPYKISLQKSLLKIQSLSGFTTPALDVYTALLKEQVATIESLSDVTVIAELTDLLAKYIYLKKAIEGKYE